mgnify:CR=1 FL=1
MSDGIILIVLDTLRLDFARRYFSPWLKKLGFIEHIALTTSPWTVPAHVSIFSGLYPSFHGVYPKNDSLADFVIPRRLTKFMLHDYLVKKGYRTIFLSSNPYISPSFGYRSIDAFYDTTNINRPIIELSENEKYIISHLRGLSRMKRMANLIKRHKLGLLSKIIINYIYRKTINLPIIKDIDMKRRKWPLDKGASKINDLLKRINFGKKFFLFINYMEAHEPYTKDNSFTKQVLENVVLGRKHDDYYRFWKKKYEDEVRYLLTKVNESLDILKDLEVFNNSLIIITSDHGQLLGEHDRLGHGMFLYDELIKVPLYIKPPNNAKIREPYNHEALLSLAKIKRFIKNYVENKIVDITLLKDDLPMAEVFGMNYVTQEIKNILKNVNEDKLKKAYMSMKKHRIAVCFNNCKIVYNVNNGSIEMLFPYCNEATVRKALKRIRKRIGLSQQLIFRNRYK